jgi:hypothetical protein
MVIPLSFYNRVFSCATAQQGLQKKELFFGQPGGSAVLSMQNEAAYSRHDLASPGSASPAAALLCCLFLFGVGAGMHTHSRRSRVARG